MAVEIQKNLRGYELREQIGKGGSGAVYRAYQPVVDREVAVKVILPQYANHPDFVRSFEAEARMIARLEHPFIVPLFDYWREPDGTYLVMRFFPAGTLKHYLKDHGAIPPEKVAQMLLQIASALDTAHRNQVIHRDIKPANILLDSEGNAYLADFGIAKKIDQPTTNERQNFQGTLAYAPPETLQSGEVTAQSDIYSLGFTIHEMLAGKHAFADMSPMAMMAAQFERPLSRIDTVSEGINLVLMRATAKDPEDRYATAQLMAREFLAAVNETAPMTAGSRLAAPEIEEISVNPYKGLRPFEEADARDFFGRSAVIQQLLDRLCEDHEYQNFLAVVGPSGSGKSSVVHAGLLPALRNEKITGSDNWFIITMTPGSNPVQQLKTALLGVAIDADDTLTSILEQSDHGLTDALEQFLDIKVPLVLVIDQFEEVFTLVGNEEERDHFLNLLHHAVTQPDSRLKLIITLRADFYDKPLLYENFGALVQSRTQVILPLKTDELQQAITGPAKRVGLEFDSDLVAAIVSDVRQEPGALPLLQYALTELFEQRDGKYLHLDAYRKSGGVSGALARRAEEVYKQLSPEQQLVAEQIFLRLVSPGEGTEDTRRRARYSELIAVKENRKTVQSVLDAYGKYRLLTFDNDAETREPTIEVAHEALIREWKRLRAWLNESRDDLRLQQMLINLMTEWRGAKRDDSYLLRGARLAQFEEWMRTSDIVLSQDEREFLDASSKEHRRQQAAETERQAQKLELERRARRRLQMIVGILLVASVIGILLTIQVFNESQNARRERDIAQRNLEISDSLRQATVAQQLLSAGDTVEALKQAMAAVSIDNPPELSLETLINIAYEPGLHHLVDQGENAVTAVAISPDGRYVLSGAGTTDQGGAAQRGQPPGGGPGQPPAGGQGQPPQQQAPQNFSLVLWDMESGEQVRQFSEHRAAFSDVLFLDDNRAVTAAVDGLITLWDVAAGEVVNEVRIPAFEKVTLSGNEDLLLITGGKVSGNREGGAFVWTLEGEPQPLKVESGQLWTGQSSPDGTLFILSYLDGTQIIWDVEAGEELRRFNIEEEVKPLNYEVQISPDNRTAAVSYGGSSILLWELETGTLINRIPGGTVITRRALFGSDSNTLLIISQDGILRLWDIQNGVELGVLQDRTITYETGDISRDGRFAVTASSDGTMRFWDTVENPVRQVQQFEGLPIKLATFLPDTNQIVTVGPNVGLGLSAELIVWDVESGQPVHIIEEKPSFMPQALEISPDGALGVMGMITRAPGIQVPPDVNNSIIAWDLTTGEEYRRIDLGGRPSVFDLVFNPNNNREMLATHDMNIRLWNIETGEMVREYTGHTRPPKAMAFLPDGQTFISIGDDQMVRLWDFETGENTRTIELESRSDFIILAPDGKTAAIANAQNEIVLLDIESGSEIRRLSGHTDGVLSFQFSPDGKQALSGSWDNTFILWDMESGEIIRQYKEHNGAIWTVDFHPDGERILSVAEGAGMIVWRLWDSQPNPPLDEVMAWIESHRYVGE